MDERRTNRRRDTLLGIRNLEIGNSNSRNLGYNGVFENGDDLVGIRDIKPDYLNIRKEQNLFE